MPSSLHSAWLQCHHTDPRLPTLPDRKSGGPGNITWLHPDTQSGLCLSEHLRDLCSKEEIQAKAPNAGFTELSSSPALLWRQATTLAAIAVTITSVLLNIFI